jgi:WD40 repeat protein
LVFNLLSGVCINTLESHSEENGEISFIGYGDEDLTIITTAWDRIIKVHKDDRNENQKPSENVLRAMRKCHKRDIISGDYAHNLGLIATGGKDNLVRIWDYERMKHENEIIAHKDEVTTVKFLKPFPLLMTADSKGVMYIWYINPQLSGTKKCVMRWTNKFSIELECNLTDPLIK